MKQERLRTGQSKINQRVGMKTIERLFFLWFAAMLTLLILEVSNAHAENYSINEVADAIYKAEGGSSADFLYGIRSVPYKDEAEARHICINSIKNGYKRWIKAGKPMGFLEHFSQRYCPPKAHKLNVNWVGNVKYWLVRNREMKQ